MTGIIDSVGDFFSGAIATVSNSWDSAVNKLKNTAVEFIGLFRWLETKQNVAKRDPTTWIEYQTAMKRGATIKTAVEKTTGGVDWLNGQLTRFTGKGLNALPAVPVALTAGTILGLVAAMSYWITDAYKLQKKIQYIEQHGISGSDAMEILTGDNTKTIIGLVALGAMVYFITREN